MSWLKREAAGDLPPFGGAPKSNPSPFPGAKPFPPAGGKPAVPPMGGASTEKKEEAVTADKVQKDLKKLIQSEKAEGHEVKDLESALKSIDSFLKKDDKEDKAEEKPAKEEKADDKEMA
jgi:hypothetical protein